MKNALQVRQKLSPSRANRDCNDAVNCLQAIGIVSHDTLTECVHLNSCAYGPSEAEKKGMTKRNRLRNNVKETKQKLTSIELHFNALQRLSFEKMTASCDGDKMSKHSNATKT